MNRTYDVVIVGAGPAGIFTAIEMLRRGTKKKILIVEKGKAIEKRVCPKAKTKKCMNCKPCHITTGFSGAGAFSDGKLSLCEEVGGDLPNLIGADFAKEMIDYTDSIYLEFGADTHIEGLEHEEEKKEIRRNAIKAGLKLVDCPIRHLGTEKAQEIYYAIEQYLLKGGVEILFDTECRDLLITESEVCHGIVIATKDGDEHIEAEEVIVATGRRGAEWLEKLCAEHHIAHQPGTVDIGVRVEVRNEIMEKINTVLYESKLVGHPAPFKNKVRTFCQNPGGFVSQENYDHGLAVVNGHSYKDLKSSNTNLAILVSHNFSTPFNQPIEYAQKVGELTNMLGAGHILVQRFGDILDGKRTWPKELAESNVRPTLPDAEAGDITAAMPYRAMMNIINFIKAVDHVVPGFASYETLLYSPELKFYSNRVKMDENFTTSVRGLHCLGDSSGWTRGLMMASVMGVIMGRKLMEKEQGK
ncbi:MAG TPA: FAD-dependent oxidoreductase [Clostridiales bacterium]|nr:FAD-dependent oxidoreductase [Clostridiales bacterium]